MAIKVDKAKCIGCGACASVCGQVFEIKGGKSQVKAQKDLPCVNQAIAACPVQAIKK